MPNLSIDMFENPPSVGDQVTVSGKVESIDKDTGEVQISYDKVDVAGNESSQEESTDKTPESLDEAMEKHFGTNNASGKYSE